LLEVTAETEYQAAVEVLHQQQVLALTLVETVDQG
jgi:hypothetical protein